MLRLPLSPFLSPVLSPLAPSPVPLSFHFCLSFSFPLCCFIPLSVRSFCSFSPLSCPLLSLPVHSSHACLPSLILWPSSLLRLLLWAKGKEEDPWTDTKTFDLFVTPPLPSSSFPLPFSCLLPHFRTFLIAFYIFTHLPVRHTFHVLYSHSIFGFSVCKHRFNNSIVFPFPFPLLSKVFTRVGRKGYWKEGI